MTRVAQPDTRRSSTGTESSGEDVRSTIASETPLAVLGASSVLLSVALVALAMFAAREDAPRARPRLAPPAHRVDLSRASYEEIAALPRIGPGLASRIVADRAARGPFSSLDDLARVPGIGEGILEAIRVDAIASAP